MSNPYLYAVIALAIALVIISAYLGTMVSSETAKTASLQGEVNALRTNYNELKTQYAQLQSQYAQLQANYSELEANYTGIMREVSVYKSMIMPVAYIYEGQPVSGAMIALNITNPTGKPMNITLWLYAGPPFSSGILGLPTMATMVMIPPGITLELPVVLAYYNTTGSTLTTLYSMGYYTSWANLTPSTFAHVNFTIVILSKGFSNLGVLGIVYNTTMGRAVVISEPVGYATYYPSGFSIGLYLMNPLMDSLTINGYEVYDYNGTLLTSCRFGNALGINSTSIVWLSLPTQPQTFMSLDVSTLTSSGYESWFFASSLSCTNNYQFPSSIDQMPYGYAVLNTSIGDIVIPLVPGYNWWW